MGKHRTPYPAEFRAQMVELMKAGRTPEELEKEFEPTAQTIYNWVAQADRDAGRRHGGLTTAEREELTRLRRKVRQLEVERDILAKAATWFARRPGPCPRRVRVHESESGQLAHYHHGTAAEAVHQRFLRVAWTRAIETGTQRYGSAGAHSCDTRARAAPMGCPAFTPNWSTRAFMWDASGSPA